MQKPSPASALCAAARKEGRATRFGTRGYGWTGADGLLDTLIENSFEILADESADAVAWVKPVPDPRRFGVAEVDGRGLVTRLIEKPNDMNNNLAVVGAYYFADGQALLAAIEEQFKRNVQLKGEYFLTDAINIMLSRR